MYHSFMWVNCSNLKPFIILVEQIIDWLIINLKVTHAHW